MSWVANIQRQETKVCLFRDRLQLLLSSGICLNCNLFLFPWGWVGICISSHFCCSVAFASASSFTVAFTWSEGNICAVFPPQPCRTQVVIMFWEQLLLEAVAPNTEINHNSEHSDGENHGENFGLCRKKFALLCNTSCLHISWDSCIDSWSYWISLCFCCL